ncbi:hypothetical protein C8J56DRAFT_1022325 [Mycena floridula]|nr:hypothetical protein C8J56DRAFT_1022325 [Mycena floridula]
MPSPCYINRCLLYFSVLNLIKSVDTFVNTTVEWKLVEKELQDLQQEIRTEKALICDVQVPERWAAMGHYSFATRNKIVVSGPGRLRPCLRQSRRHVTFKLVDPAPLLERWLKPEPETQYLPCLVLQQFIISLITMSFGRFRTMARSVTAMHQADIQPMSQPKTIPQFSINLAFSFS